MATTFANTIADAQDGVLELVTKSQKAVLDQVNALGTQITKSFPGVELPEFDGLPLADALGTPAELLGQGFAFAGKVLEAQKDFALKLIASIDGMVSTTTAPKAAAAKTTTKA